MQNTAEDTVLFLLGHLAILFNDLLSPRLVKTARARIHVCGEHILIVLPGLAHKTGIFHARAKRSSH